MGHNFNNMAVNAFNVDKNFDEWFPKVALDQNCAFEHEIIHEYEVLIVTIIII